MISFAMAHLSLIVLRVKEPDRNRPFKLKFNLKIKNGEIPVSAIIGFIATFTVWVIILITHKYGRNVGLLWMLMGVCIYVWYRYKQKMPMVEAVEVKELNIPEFHRMKFQRILVPTRGSALVEMLQTACKIAKEDGSKITAIYVMEIPNNMPLDTFLPKEYIESNNALDHARAIAREYGLDIDTKLIQARFAGDAIIDTAKDLDADLIVLGASNQPRLGDVIFGTTADYVIKNAKCRVWASFARTSLPR